MRCSNIKQSWGRRGRARTCTATPRRPHILHAALQAPCTPAAHHHHAVRLHTHGGPAWLPSPLGQHASSPDGSPTACGRPPRAGQQRAARAGAAAVVRGACVRGCVGTQRGTPFASPPACLPRLPLPHAQFAAHRAVGTTAAGRDAARRQAPIAGVAAGAGAAAGPSTSQADGASSSSQPGSSSQSDRRVRGAGGPPRTPRAHPAHATRASEARRWPCETWGVRRAHMPMRAHACPCALACVQAARAAGAGGWRVRAAAPR